MSAGKPKRSKEWGKAACRHVTLGQRTGRGPSIPDMQRMHDEAWRKSVRAAKAGSAHHGERGP